ncbi:MAG: SDR family NAD(P)-dependent oxidoreductase [Litorilituus sp.]|jgi:short-subunit dehydrogenase|nr:SDR family NAD(P)-dependent oxidoreductase [Litorilituus sp.]
MSETTLEESPKTVLITGASSGIGLALYHKYNALGYRVIVCGRDRMKLAKYNADADLRLSFDVNDIDSVAEASTKVNDIDILILNAGTCEYIDHAKQFNGQIFRRVVNTNLVSMGALLEHFLPKLSFGGQVAFISSSATIIPFQKAEAYGASKAGLDYLADSLRVSLQKEGLAVCLIHPGFVRTPLTDKNTFAMPFLLSAEQAAERIYQGINKKQTYLHFPKRLTLLLKFLGLLPQSFSNLLLAKEY